MDDSLLVPPHPPARLDARAASEIAVGLARRIAMEHHREIADDWHVTIPSVMLTTLAGPELVAVYTVTVELSRPPSTFRRGGRCRLVVQLDPESGGLVGWQDEGLAPYHLGD
jgi:hypothetical protein